MATITVAECTGDLSKPPEPSAFTPTLLRESSMTAQLDTDTTAIAPAATEPPAAGGNPLIAGLPGFVIGSFALALQLTGFVSASAAGVVLPITFGASAISTLIATIWAARVGENVAAVTFVTFTGFWISYTLLVLSLTHGWLNIPTDEVARAQALFLLSWLFLMGALTVGSLRLPWLFAANLFFVDLALVFNTVAALTGVQWATVLAGCSALVFTLIGTYLLIGAVMECGGAKPFPVGSPLLNP
ncbi:acetate uptake transporter family protein [Streptomyces phaeochromogenes]|uniref:GPR1/FUN34/YaaH family transporter n=1 Tax=Streptomyces phaeochromogenes TaxID=1923 RepID=UPI0038650FE4|nr:acetate uptake transporter family protein [Streptomyces phaeochromogenes]